MSAAVTEDREGLIAVPGQIDEVHVRLVEKPLLQRPVPHPLDQVEPHLPHQHDRFVRHVSHLRELPRIETLEEENRGLVEALGASQGQVKLLGERVEFLEATLKSRDDEIRETDIELDRVKEERDRFEAEKNELLMNGTVKSASIGELIAELWRRITKAFHRTA